MWEAECEDGVSGYHTEPSDNGWYNVLWPGDSPAQADRVYIHITDGVVVWGWDEADDPEYIGTIGPRLVENADGLHIPLPEDIRFRKASQPPTD